MRKQRRKEAKHDGNHRRLQARELHRKGVGNGCRRCLSVHTLNRNRMSEVWKPIKGYEGIYEVSSYGRVRSIDHDVMQVCSFTGKLTCFRYKGKMLTPKESHGYLRVMLWGEKPVMRLIHRLVAQEFIPNPDNLPQINHKDENKLNNHVDNLEWCTGSYNTSYNHLQDRRYDNGAGARKRPIEQLTLDGQHIVTFESVCEAVRQTGFSNSAITDVLRGRHKTSHGYRWRYVE